MFSHSPKSGRASLANSTDNTITNVDSDQDISRAAMRPPVSDELGGTVMANSAGTEAVPAYLLEDYERFQNTIAHNEVISGELTREERDGNLERSLHQGARLIFKMYYATDQMFIQIAEPEVVKAVILLHDLAEDLKEESNYCFFPSSKALKLTKAAKLTELLSDIRFACYEKRNWVGYVEAAFQDPVLIQGFISHRVRDALKVILEENIKDPHRSFGK